MGFNFNFFGENEHRVFNYKPRYFDPEAEERKKLFGKVDGLSDQDRKSARRNGSSTGTQVQGEAGDKQAAGQQAAAQQAAGQQAAGQQTAAQQAAGQQASAQQATGQQTSGQQATGQQTAAQQAAGQQTAGQPTSAHQGKSAEYTPGQYIKGSFRDGNYQKLKKTSGSRMQKIIGAVGLVLVFVILYFFAKFYGLTAQ